MIEALLALVVVSACAILWQDAMRAPKENPPATPHHHDAERPAPVLSTLALTETSKLRSWFAPKICSSDLP